MSRKLVLFVEGESDGPAIGNLVNRCLNELPAELQGLLIADGSQAYKVGNVPKVSGSEKCQRQWTTRLQRAQLERNFGGVLAVFDGDEDEFEGRPFCAIDVGRTLVDRARTVGAGVTFSLAIVILSQEYESLLVAAAAQLPGLRSNAVIPTDPEVAPRGAKKWLRDNLGSGYKQSSDQLAFTRLIRDWTPYRRMRCFRRLESAILQLAQATANGSPIATPSIIIPPVLPPEPGGPNATAD